MNKINFKWHFPISSLLVRNGHILCGILCIVALAISLFCDQVYAFGLANIGVGLLGLWIDRDCLDRWLIVPTVWAALICILSAGVGPMLMMTYGSYEDPSKGLMEMQLAVFLGYLAFFIAYRSCRPSMKRIPPFRNILSDNAKLRNALFFACLLCLAFGVISKIVGAVTGASDRGMAGEAASFQMFGIWTYFNAFARLITVGVILAPIVWVYGNFICKFYVLATTFVIFSMGFLSGSRSEALIPVVAIIIGYFGFVARPRIKLEYFMWFLIPVGAVIFVFMDYFRNTSIFNEEALADPIKRLGAITEARERASDVEEGTGLYLIGSRMMGTIDPLIFTQTPEVIPYAGFEDADAIMWLYLPYFFFPNRPVMQDGKILGERYLGYELIRTAIGPSLTGDWYRRFGWAGVVVGMAITGLFFALYIRVLVYGFKRQHFWAMALWLVLTEFVMKDANMTVLTGIWWILYDVPKNAFILMIIMYCGSNLISSKTAALTNK